MKLKNLSSVILAAMMAATTVPCTGLVPYSNMNAYAVEAETIKTVAEGTCGEKLTWILYDDGYIYIDGEGAMDNWASADDVPWAEYRDQIKRIRAPKEVKNVGDYAFYDCVNLEYAFAPTVIGEHAYENCKNITNYYMYEGPIEIKDYAFYGCDKLNRVTIHNSLCVIADSEFVFPENSTICGYAGSTAQAYAEKYGREFAEIANEESSEQAIVAEGTCGETLDWNIQSDKRLFINGDGVMDSYVGYSNWEEYTELFDTVEYSGKLANYGEYAFYNCKNLKEFEIAPVIGAHAFEGCSNISGVMVPAGFVLNEIGDYAFYGCDNLGGFIIGNPECIIADSPYVFPESMTIFGIAGSTAQAYAEKYGREFVDISAPGFGEQPIVAEGKCGENLTWTLYEDEKVLIISGEGAMDSWENPDETPWAEYNSFIEAVRLENGVANIGDNAFAAFNSEHLDIVIIENPDCIIPDSESVIPVGMAIGCAEGSTAQAYAEKYGKVFEFFEFQQPEEEETDVISKGTLFEKFPYKITSYGEFIIEGEGELDGITRWSLAFENSDKIKTVTLSDDITAIGEYNFFNCKNLGYMQIGENVESIGDYAFYGCYDLYDVHIWNPQCVIAESPYVFPKNTVICGYAGSTAEAYAKKYDRSFYAFPVEVATGTLSETITWKLNSDGGLYIDGNGIMPDFDGENPWGEYADSIEYVQISGDIANVGDYAFYNCKNLFDAYGEVKTIGEHAFDGCEKLESFYSFEEAIEIKDYAFYGCDSLGLANIQVENCIIADSPNVFPENTTIEGICDSLKSYAEKYNLNYVDCTLAVDGKLDDNFTWSIFNNGVLNVDGEGDMLDGDGANHWGDYADKIEYVTLNVFEGSLGDYAFFNLKNLKEVIYGYSPDSELKIGTHTFEECDNLQYFGAWENFVEIGDYAFNGCDNLESVFIENPECVIADSEFVFPENTVICGYTGSTAEAYAKKYNRTFEANDADEQLVGEGPLTETISYTLTKDGVLTITGEGELIGPDCEGFWGSLTDKIKTIELSGDITEIDDYVFYGCENLEYVNIPVSNKLAVIGAHAFENCENLKAFPFINVLTVMDYAFNGCKSLENVVISDPECEIADSEFTFPEHTVIIALAGSNAEAYAEKYDRTFETALEIIFGDVNGDESIDSSDASLVLGEYAAVQTGAASSFTENQKKAADVNKDGDVSATDASAILAYYADAATGKKPSWD